MKEQSFFLENGIQKEDISLEKRIKGQKINRTTYLKNIFLEEELYLIEGIVN